MESQSPAPGPGFGPLTEYLVDAAQRSVLYWDIMRQRGNQYFEHVAQEVPHVLHYDFELVVDGRTLPEPVNYGLVRILPREGYPTDELKRPCVIVDPRAGHGPGIGGFKADSEIGVALRAGHPCYFIGFTPEPQPGQTLETIMRAEARFLEKVIELHPRAEGKPFIVGNCQAGWAISMLAATHPELCGPLILAGSPLSYWAGERGKNPMRYLGGLLGGSWLTALTGDAGHGKFDGGWLVYNFEGLNPANTLWGKQYNVYAKVDTEGPRYLGFERWWGGLATLNAEEMQTIADDLFIGNKLSAAELVTSDNLRIDLRNISSPIVVFCSKGDNITPPAQALGWILDLYESVDDIRVAGQTIVYAVHDKIGHLGIFVSGAVAKKEHQEFAQNIDLIDCLPPGLYEAVLSEKASDDPNADLAAGDYITRFEARTLDDVRAFGRNDAEDDRAFATVARVSEVNHGLYRTLAQSMVQSLVTPEFAEWARRLHPVRLGYELVSDRDPLMKPIADAAEKVRADRKPAAPDNPFWRFQEQMSQNIAAGLDLYRDWRDAMVEQTFFAIYGNPWMQALVGLRASDEPARRNPGMSPEHMAYVERAIDELKATVEVGGPIDAAIRALIYVRMPDGAADERGFGALKRIRAADQGRSMTLEAFKAAVRRQYFTLLLDERRAIAAIPTLLRGHEDEAGRLLADLRQIATSGEPLGVVAEERLEEIASLFGGAAPATPRPRRRSRPKVESAA